MQLLEKAGDVATALLVSAVMGIFGGIMWLVRRVITNQSQIEMMHKSLEYRDEMLQTSLKSRDKRLDEIRDDMKAMRQRMDGNP
jgi:hypothetical protein